MISLTKSRIACSEHITIHNNNNNDNNNSNYYYYYYKFNEIFFYKISNY